MTNPFKAIAPALGVRGVLFSILGLVLLARAIPTLMSMAGVPDIPAAVIGLLLLTVGVADLIRAVQRVTRLRTEKLDVRPIDYMYVRGNGGEGIPRSLMDGDNNPNDVNQPKMIEWLARIWPKVAFVPRPYTGALHAAMTAFMFGVLGVVGMILLRVLLTGSADAAQLSMVLDWSLWAYFVAGFVFWAAISRFGFRRALHFEGNLRGGAIVGIFAIVLVAAILGIIGSSVNNAAMPEPPALGILVPLLVLGSLLVIGATVAIVLMRSRRAPEQYAVQRAEEFFTVGMHPTDMINVIKSHTGKMPGGDYTHLGSWKPAFAEHTAVSAGEFEANLNAESSIKLNESAGSPPEKRIGTMLGWIGLTLTALAGLFLFRAAAIDWTSSLAIGEAFRLPVALMIFGALFYRLSLIPLAEIEWTSVITNVLISGTFQTQGGMALMNAGDQSIKGSVLTSATVQPRCAFLSSVGFLRPGRAKNLVPRTIDRVEPADQVCGEILSAIHNQARQMMSVGTQVPPMQVTLPEPTNVPPEAIEQAPSAGNGAATTDDKEIGDGADDGQQPTS